MSDFQSSNQSPREARKPIQSRSTARMAKVIEAAEHMLEQIGPERTSIPALAEASGVPRASIYQFFPDKYSLFTHMAEIEMQDLTVILRQSKVIRTPSWREWVAAAIKITAAHYNARPVASILLLSGNFAEANRTAHETKNKVIGDLLRAEFVRSGELPRLPTTPDVATIAVEIAFACMKYGYVQDGQITVSICGEATRAVTSYLDAWDVS